MKIQVPAHCKECFYIKQLDNLVVCGSPSFPEEMKTLDIISFKVNPDSSPPEWCPYITTNNFIATLPQEKQDAIDNIWGGLAELLGWNKIKEKKDHE
jgi:hypothetical protein